MNTKLIPFDIEKAKAGAKVVFHDNTSVEIITLQGRGDYPVIGYVGEDEIAGVWTKDGKTMPSPHYDPVIFLSVSTFPDPPENEEWHNVGNLTPEQVGEGYRLLLKSEIKKRKSCVFIGIWNVGLERWGIYYDDGYEGSNEKMTYRAPIDIPFHWDKPKEPAYRPFTFEEIKGHIGRVVKSKDGTAVGLINHASKEALRVGIIIHNYQNLMDYCTFLDGSPCGVPVEN